MAQTLRVTPVVGLPQFTGWSHVLEHIIDPETKCVFCFSISGENASNVGREIIESILVIPPRSAQGLYQAFEDASEIARTQNCVLSMVAGVFRYKRSIFAALSGSILLKRNTKVGKIVHADDAIAVIEGKYDLDDVFVFSTDQARQFLSEIELHFKRGFDSDGVITAIVPALHALEDSSLCGLGFIVIVEEESLAEVVEYSATFAINEPAQDQSTATPLISIEQETAVDQMETDDQSTEASYGTTPSSSAHSSFQTVVSNLQHMLQRIWSILQLLWAKIIQVITFLQSLFSSKTYIGAPSRKKILTWVMIVGIVLLLITGLIWWYTTRSAKAAAEVEAAVSPFRQELTEIKAQAVNDPIPAREQAATLLTTLQSQHSEAEAIGDKRKAAAFNTLLSEAQSTYQEISGRDEVSELPIFYDLRLVSSDFITSVAGSNQKIAYFIDSEKKQAVALDVTTKQVIRHSLDAVGNVKSVAAGPTPEQMVLLANGLYLTTLTAEAAPVVIKEEGDSNRNATLTGSFGSYTYVFNPEKRNIYRYVAGEEGEQYSDPVGWLLDPLGVPFENISSWAIDGEIWLGSNTGQVLRFASGRKVEFVPTGLEDPFETTLHLVTKEDLEQIWILEHEKNRVVVLKKTGEFLREVKSSSLGAATGIILDDTGQRAFVISGSSIFEITL